jgi:hypothetical protein
MPTTFPPRREADLVSFTGNFKTKITAGPTPLGLVASQCTAYGLLSDDFVAKWNVVQDPETRTRPNLLLKDAAKQALLENLRELARIIQNHPGVTNAMREELGLPLRSSEPTPVPIPGTTPLLTVEKVLGHQITVKIKDSTGERRGKPQGVQSAHVFYATGATPPPAGEAWAFAGDVTRQKAIIILPSTIAQGAKVYLCAAWQNYRGMTGPACTPVVANVGYDSATPIAG